MSLKTIINQKAQQIPNGSYVVYIHTDEDGSPLHITFSEQDADRLGTPYQIQFIKVDRYKTVQGKCLP